MLIRLLKHNSFFIILLILFSNTLKSQVNNIVINEQFIDNSNFWDIYNEPESELKFNNGKYNMQGKMLGRAITSTINAPIIENQGFRISVELTKINGIDDNGFGLVWGSKDENNEYEFVISGNGQFKVIEWKNGNKRDLINWTSYSNIKKWDNATNCLRIEKKHEFVKFFINNNYVAITKLPETMGNRLGFVINETMEVEFDNLIYEKIEQQHSQNTNNKQVSIQSAVFKTNSNNTELKYNELIVLTITIENKANNPVNNLAVMVSASSNYNIEFDRINMIEEISGADRTILSIAVKADEELKSSNINFEIVLVDAQSNILDTKSLVLKTVGRGNYYVEDNYKPLNSNNTSTSKAKSDYNKNNSADGCTKGCAYITLGSLIVALISAIL